MPQINIREIDKTSSNAPLYNDYVVLIPGLTSKTGTDKPTEVLTDDLDEFITKVGSTTTGSGFKIAKMLLGLGMTILYVVIDSEAASSLSSTFWSKFEDRAKYDIRFMISSGVDAKSVHEAMIHSAAVRGDAIALIDVPDTNDGDADAILTYIDTLAVDPITRAKDTYTGKSIQENAFKYAAAFGSRWKAKGMTEYLPGSVHYLADFASHIGTNPDWFAMSGVIRGSAPYENVETEVDFGDAEVDALQKREIAASSGATQDTYKACNIVLTRRPYGKVMWGNRTLYPLGIVNDAGELQLGLTASSFLNIRHICCDIKKTLYRACTRFSFEPNSDTLWVNFKGAITPLLEEMKSGQGIRGYKIIKEKTKQKATLKARIQIIPIEAVEDFDLTVELTDSVEVTE